METIIIRNLQDGKSFLFPYKGEFSTSLKAFQDTIEDDYAGFRRDESC